MTIRRDFTKGEMMDERQIREEAWQEGRNAGYRQQAMGNLADRPLNPYTPVVEYTPSLQEMNTVLLSKFSQLEIWRGEKQREGQLAEHERVMIVEELKTFEAEILEGEMMFRAGGGNLTKLDAVRECIAVIKRKWN
jgi:hypothetical protein